MKHLKKKKTYMTVIIAIAIMVGLVISYWLVFLPILQGKIRRWESDIYLKQMDRIRKEQQKQTEEQVRQSMAEYERLRKLEQEHREKILLIKNADGWTTYRDTLYGFEIQYPPGWTSDIDGTGRAPVMIYKSETGERGVYDGNVLINLNIEVFDIRNINDAPPSYCSSLFSDGVFLPTTRARVIPKCTREFIIIENRKAVRISDETFGGNETGPRIYKELLIKMDDYKILRISIWTPLPEGRELIKIADKIFTTLKLTLRNLTPIQ